MSAEPPENATDDRLLEGIRAIARVGSSVPAPDHSVFWGAWFRRVLAQRPTLSPIPPGEGDPSDDSATHRLTSLGGVRLGVRLVEPPEGVPLRAGLVAVHGASVGKSLGQSALRWRSIAETGVCVLLVRVRGYPGSQLDTGDLASGGTGVGWITRGLDQSARPLEGEMDWVLSGAVADVVNACRAMRNRLAGIDDEQEARPLDDKLPMFLHGESLGGALATIAAAQLSGRLRQERIIERLVLSTPTLGDWHWRLSNPAPGGLGGEILRLLEAKPKLEEPILTRLHLMDTVVHAARVRTPTLCKLAMRDEVVPAPTAGAVFNALATSPGQKWRFVVPVGHAPGDRSAARRASLFVRCSADFLDPQRPVEDSMAPWEPLLLGGDRPPEAGARGAQERLFDTAPGTDESDQLLIRAYTHAGRTLDALPYTQAFESLYAELTQTLGGDAPTRQDAFHRLHNLRKRKALPRLGRAPVSLPKISPEDETLLASLVVGAVGSMGARDRLVYDRAFDALVERFNSEAGHTLRHEDAWRLIARLAK